MDCIGDDSAGVFGKPSDHSSAIRKVTSIKPIAGSFDGVIIVSPYG